MNRLFKVADSFQKKLGQVDLRPLSTLLAYLRAATHVHHTHHWQTTSPEFYADHLLFQRLYEGDDEEENLVEEMIDQIGERAVGGDSPERVDALDILDMVHDIVRKVYELVPGNTSEDMVKRSLAIEDMILENIKTTIDTLTSTDSLSPGTSNLLEGVSDLHESFVYLLKRRNLHK